MKRFFAFAAVSVALISLSSCKKDYTCTCDYTVVGIGDFSQTLGIPNSSKKNAESTCDDWKAEYASFNPTCELK